MKQHQCLEMIMDRWEEPFEIPIMISQDLHDLKATDYAVKVYNLTSSGRISRKGRSHLMLNYCPMCGEQLRDVDDGADGREARDG